MIEATSPRLALWIVGAAIVALYAHAIFYLPIPYGDQFQEFRYTLTLSPIEYFSTAFEPYGPVFRPGEWVLRYLMQYIFGPYPFSYNYLQILFLILVGAAALYMVKCRNWVDAGAGITAITFLFGHHAFPSVLEGNNTITNGLVLLLIMAALPVLQSKGELGWQVLAIAISVVAVLTKEVGLVVPFVFVAGAVLGFAGVRRWTAAVLVVLTAAYLAFRFATLPTFLGEVTGPGRAHGTQGYLSNVLTTPIMMVTGEPFDGDWSELLGRDFYPWRIIRITLGLATLGIIFTAFYLRKAAAGAFPESELVDQKWMLLLLGVVAASSALAFQYTRHRFGAMVLPVAFLLLYRSLRIVLWRLSNIEARILVRLVAVPLLFVFSLAWSSRAADGFFILRFHGAKTLLGWVEHYQDYRAIEGEHPNALPYLDSFFWAAEAMPWPTVQHDGAFVKFWLGEKDSMNR